MSRDNNVISFRFNYIDKYTDELILFTNVLHNLVMEIHSLYLIHARTSKILI